jgi:hypothetical protein
MNLLLGPKTRAHRLSDAIIIVLMAGELILRAGFHCSEARRLLSEAGGPKPRGPV